MTNHCEASVSEGWLHYKESLLLAVNTMSYWPTQGRTQERHWAILFRFVVQVLLMEHGQCRTQNVFICHVLFFDKERHLVF
jgi:hypothetical protein